MQYIKQRNWYASQVQHNIFNQVNIRILSQWTLFTKIIQSSILAWIHIAKPEMLHYGWNIGKLQKIRKCHWKQTSCHPFPLNGISISNTCSNCQMSKQRRLPYLCCQFFLHRKSYMCSLIRQKRWLRTIQALKRRRESEMERAWIIKVTNTLMITVMCWSLNFSHLTTLIQKIWVSK